MPSPSSASSTMSRPRWSRSWRAWSSTVWTSVTTSPTTSTPSSPATAWRSRSHRAWRAAMSQAQNRQLIERFWATMETNDFRAVGDLLHDDFVLDYPQSGERFRGREHWVAINANYPAHGRWHFV